MMIMKRTILATVLALTWTTWAHAVSLGPLVIESAPGEPMQGVIEVRDIDILSARTQPAIIRLATPATYDRNGMSWPKEVQDLRLESDQEKSALYLRVIGQNRFRNSSFPLLLELNVGGKVTLRQYNVEIKDGQFVASASTRLTEQDKSLQPEDRQAQEEKAVRKIVIAPRTEVSKVQQLQKRLDRKGRYAPNVVHDYVALNGFDSTKGFDVVHDMTIWSIAKLYWPAYRGTTMEQLIVAFRQKNPKAFLQTDRLHLSAGTHLEPPTTKRVYALDPEEAFRKVHGESEVMPMITKNLVDAQKMSYEAAELVARAQMAKKLAGANPLRIARAGRFALEAYREQLVEEKQLMGEANPGAVIQNPRYGAFASKNEDKALAETSSTDQTQEGLRQSTASDKSALVTMDTDEATQVDPSKQANQEETEKSPLEPSTRSVKSVEQAQEQDKPQEVSPQTPQQTTRSSDREPWWYYAIAFLCIVGAWLGLRKKRQERCPEPTRKKVGTISLQKRVPRTTKAQITALEATVSEAIKNGTTAGAMGVGAQALTDAKIRQARQEKRQRTLDNASEKEALVNKPSIQAWQEITPKASIEQRDVKASNPWEEVNGHKAPEKAVMDVSQGTKPSTPENPRGVMPELLSVKDIVGDLSLDLEEPVKPTQKKKPVAGKPATKEQAQFEAIEGKLKLAGSFIGLGALKEAQELLKVVKEQGSKDQRERALFLEERIRQG